MPSSIHAWSFATAFTGIGKQGLLFTRRPLP